MFKVFLVLIFLIMPNPALAQSNSNFELGVYPLDCIFETVNDGTNRVIFLTPLECGQEVTVTPDAPQQLQQASPITVVPVPEAVQQGSEPVLEQLLEPDYWGQIVIQFLAIIATLPTFSAMIFTFLTIILVIIQAIITRFWVWIMTIVSFIVGKV